MSKWRVLVVLVVLALAAGCSSSGDGNVVPTTTTAPSPASRAQVVDMLVWSLPESPVLNRDMIRNHWAEIVARLPEHLPAVIPSSECETGPMLTVYLRNGSKITYRCKLPPAIKAVRDYMVSVVSRSASSNPN